jgi:hypothetical protein
MFCAMSSYFSFGNAFSVNLTIIDLNNTYFWLYTISKDDTPNNLLSIIKGSSEISSIMI